MAAIGGLLGISGGQSGTGVAAPGQANIIQPTSAEQLGQAYQGSQNSLQSQQALLQALQAQNGIANQNQVFNQVEGVVNGTGPNPAQAMLNQATGANVSNQAALMAGQRGAGANVGLIARQAGMQGANTQQQAAGQAATLQANQSLNALTNAGNMAGQQVANQIGATNANTLANQQEQQNLLAAQAAANQAAVGSQGSVNTANASLANNIMGGQQKLIGGAFQGAGASGVMGGGIQNAAGGAALMAHGGEVPGPMSSHGKRIAAGGKVPAMVSPGEIYLDPNRAKEVAGSKEKAKEILARQAKVPGRAIVSGDSSKNDTVPAELETGGVVIPRSKTMPEDAARFVAAVLAKKGKK